MPRRTRQRSWQRILRRRWQVETEHLVAPRWHLNDGARGVCGIFANWGCGGFRPGAAGQLK
jgi:hypothetical protein